MNRTLIVLASLSLAFPALAAQKLPIDPLHLNSKAAPSVLAVPAMGTKDAVTKAALNASAIIADLQAADSVASAMPQTGFALEQHTCFPAAIAFIQSLPTAQNVPSPTAGTAGVITAFATTQLKVDAIAKFAENIATNGFPDQFKMACSPWALDTINKAVATEAALTGFIAALLPK